MDQDYWPRLAVRDGDWKLLISDDPERTELFDLRLDRSESMDVSKQHPDVVNRLSSLAIEWSSTLPEQPSPQCIATSGEVTRQ